MADLLRKIPAVDTLDTTRLLGKEITTYNIYLTKLVYPSTKVAWRPNAVILAPSNSFHYGLLAAPLIHFPVNAPIFLIEPENIHDETLGEISRLSPTGKNVPAKIIIVGPISSVVEKKLNTLGFSTFRMHGDNPISTAGEVLEFRYNLPPDPNHMADMKNIMIVPSENHSESLHTSYFSAHIGLVGVL